MELTPLVARAESWAPLLVVLSTFVVVLAAPMAVAVAYLVDRYAGVEFGRALAGSVGVPAVAGVLAALVLGGPLAVAAVAGVVLAVAVAPLAVGQWLTERYADLPPAVAARRVSLAWPVALAAAGFAFVAPGGVSRYNALFLDSPLRELVVLACLAVAVLGPGALVAWQARRSTLTRDTTQG